MSLTAKVLVLIIVCMIVCINNTVSRAIRNLPHHHRHHDHHRFHSRLRLRQAKSRGSRLTDINDELDNEIEGIDSHSVKKRQNGKDIDDVIWESLQHRITKHKTLDELLYRNVMELADESVCNYKVTDYSSDKHILPVKLTQITCDVGDLKGFCKSRNYEDCCVQVYSTISVERKDGSGFESVAINTGCVYAKMPEIKGLKADVDTDC